MYTIQHNVPLAKIRRGSGRKRKYQFEEMGVGDFFFVPGAKRASLGTYVSRAGKDLGRKFRTIACYMRKTERGWVEVEPTDSGAVEGVGVWRMK